MEEDGGTLKIKLESFEGPLDLLLHLIQKSEIDIYDIPIAQVTNQYIEFLKSAREIELEVASEFLLMAATLLEIKSRMLLPKPPKVEAEWDEWEQEAEDPRQQLVEKLLEYKKFKELAESLREKEVDRSLIYTRERADLSPFLPTEPDNPVIGLSVVDLIHAFGKALKKVAQANQFAKIRRDEISVKDRIREVYHLLEQRGGKCLFSHLFLYHITREEIVVTFLALLEMMKTKQIICYQHQLFDEIVIQRRSQEGGAIVNVPAEFEIDN
jgi:segregation and condensation protein A